MVQESFGTGSSNEPSWQLTAKAFYVWNFGDGPGTNTIDLDAFDVTLGEFLPGDFVDVSPDDSRHSITASANNGEINPSTELAPQTAYTIAARDAISEPMIRSSQFRDWQSVPSLTNRGEGGGPLPTIGGPNIVVYNEAVLVAFAMYNDVRPSTSVDDRYVERGVIVGLTPADGPGWWIRYDRLQGIIGPIVPFPDPHPRLQVGMAQIAIAQTIRGLATSVADEAARGTMQHAALEATKAALATMQKEVDALLEHGDKKHSKG
jgi:hypothetical protein